MSRNLILVIPLVVVSLSSASLAEGITEAHQGMSRLRWGQELDFGVKDARVLAENAIRKYVVEVDAQILRISPKERDWIEAELFKDDDASRRVFLSPEYSVSLLNDWIDDCFVALDRIRLSHGVDDKANYELAAWISLRNCSYYEPWDDVYRSEIPNGENVAADLIIGNTKLKSLVFSGVVPEYIGSLLGWTFIPPM
jgi:hypothetical protein